MTVTQLQEVVKASGCPTDPEGMANNEHAEHTDADHHDEHAEHMDADHHDEHAEHTDAGLIIKRSLPWPNIKWSIMVRV